MQPYELLDSHTTPDGRPLTLHRQGDDLFIAFDGRELMSTRTHRTECTLARVACRELAGRKSPTVVVVAEFYAPVIEWNRQHAGRLGHVLEDARVHLRHADVWDVLDGSQHFDAVLLDVDNGPIGETLESNDRLYQGAGLRRIRGALAAGGLLAVWSAHPDEAFERRLRQAGFRDVRAEIARTGRGRGARHVIFLGTAPR